MKKLLAIALAMCLLLSLTACGEEKGVTVANGLNWDLTEIYITEAGTESWGDPVFDSLESGENTVLYLEATFGSREISVDIRAVDEDGDMYEVFGVPLTDGGVCTLQMSESSDFFLKTDEAVIYGYWIYEDEEEPIERQLSDLEGVWEFLWEDQYILFYNDLSWETVDYEGAFLDSGEYRFEDQEVTLAMDGQILSFTWDEEGDLCSEDEDVILTFVCDFESELYQEFLEYTESMKCYFEENGYEINYEFGDGYVFMDDGAFIIVSNGQYYDRMPVMFSLDLISCVDVPDGYVEIVFTKTVYLDGEARPDIINHADSYSAGVTNGLYDYYTGFVLPISTAYGDTAQGENYYSYEYESRGETVCVDYHYTTAWEQYADGSATVTTENFIRMPADYDGLVYAVTEAYADFATYALSTTADTEGREITLMQDADVENAFFCRINTVE